MFSGPLASFLTSGLSGLAGASASAVPDIARNVAPAQQNSTTNVGSMNNIGTQASQVINAVNSMQGTQGNMPKDTTQQTTPKAAQQTNWFGLLSGFNQAENDRREATLKALNPNYAGDNKEQVAELMSVVKALIDKQGGAE